MVGWKREWVLGRFDLYYFCFFPSLSHVSDLVMLIVDGALGALIFLSIRKQKTTEINNAKQAKFSRTTAWLLLVDTTKGRNFMS